MYWDDLRARLPATDQMDLMVSLIEGQAAVRAAISATGLGTVEDMVTALAGALTHLAAAHAQLVDSLADAALARAQALPGEVSESPSECPAPGSRVAHLPSPGGGVTALSGGTAAPVQGAHA